MKNHLPRDVAGEDTPPEEEEEVTPSFEGAQLQLPQLPVELPVSCSHRRFGCLFQGTPDEVRQHEHEVRQCEHEVRQREHEVRQCEEARRLAHHLERAEAQRVQKEELLQELQQLWDALRSRQGFEGHEHES